MDLKEIAMSKAKGADHSALLREMSAVGVPVDLSAAEAELVAKLDVEIEQVGGVHESMIFDLSDGRVGCLIDILIVNQMSSYPVSRYRGASVLDKLGL